MGPPGGGDRPQGRGGRATGRERRQGLRGRRDGHPAAASRRRPVCSWDPVPGATLYASTTRRTRTSPPPRSRAIPTTYNTMFQLDTGQPVELSARQPGRLGVLLARRPVPGRSATAGPARCPPTPLPDTGAFRKASPAVAGLTSSSDPNASEITFSWQDYYDTNQATIWNGETSATRRPRPTGSRSTTSPRSPRPSTRAWSTRRRSRPTTGLYPEGTYCWRVQAIDDESHGLSVVAGAHLHQDQPAGDADLAGRRGLGVRHDPVPLGRRAVRRVVHGRGLRDNDLTFSSANRVFTATVKTTAYAPSSPLPASGTAVPVAGPASDASDNPARGRRRSPSSPRGAAPGLLTPQPRHLGLEQAAPSSSGPRCRERRRTCSTSTGPITTKYATVATAYAPTRCSSDGAYTWSVTALDRAASRSAPVPTAPSGWTPRPRPSPP